MNNLIKRICITIGVTLIIIFSLNKLLEIKHDNKNENLEWDWEKENKLIFNLLCDKYPSEDSENFMMVMMKDKEIPKKEKDEKRILVVGDSFVYGYGGTNVNYTWWKQLNLQIKEAGYSNVNVYGAGRFFVNTKDQLEKILKNETLMKKIDPDLIIIGYVPNDPEERDETNKVNLIKTLGDPIPEDNELYKKNPLLYKELEERYVSMESDYDKLKSMGDLLGRYRWDIWTMLIVEGENFERYKKVLKEVDDYINELKIPYFYYFSNFEEKGLTNQAEIKVYNTVKEMGINAYFQPLNPNEIRKRLPNDSVFDNLGINPGDSHPGIAKTYYYGKYAFNILKQDYGFLFENAKMQDINELELNINDTMPFLKITKEGKNIFEFEYPKNESVITEESRFLYYPLENNYVKLNLEYPKDVSTIVVKGENLKNAEVYVNTIDSKYDFDIKEAEGVLTPCKKTIMNKYKVGYKIASVNIMAEFYNEEDRTIQIEFIE